MAAHGIWNGSISFGLVTIPITLRSATQEQDLKFTMLDKKNLAPVGYKHVNKKTGKEVAWADIVKGHEYAKDKYVIIKPEDFEKANVKANRVLEIEDFVDLAELEPIYFETPYYIVPLAQGDKAYRLLRDALSKTKKVGIGRVVLHTKYRLVAIVPMGEILVLEVLRFPHELRPLKDLELPKGEKRAKASEREVAMAQQLIAGLTSAWNPDKYKDTYHDDLLRMIKTKIKRGATAEVEPYNEPTQEPSAGGKVIDLMPLLRASLAQPKRASKPGAKKENAKLTPKRRAAADKPVPTQRRASRA